MLTHTLLHLLPRDPLRLAPELVNLANFLVEFPLGNRRLDLERAIACFNQALEVFTRQAIPVHWATTQNNLQQALRQLDEHRTQQAIS
jgi:hypothetical protein